MNRARIEPDVVVVGAGHNGLACAATLARAGLRVEVVEARTVPGGCSATEDAVGARVNLCSCDHTMVLANPLVSELELARHGLHYLTVDPGLVGVGWEGGPPVVLFRDPDRTLAALSRTHPGAVRGYRRYLEDALPAARLLVAVSNGEPRASRVLAAVLRARGRGARRLWEWKDRSLVDVASRYLDDERLVRPFAATTTGVWGVAPSAPGTGFAALSFAMRHVVGVGRPRGGSGMLAASMVSSLEAAGGSIRYGASVRAITSDGGCPTVILAGGAVLRPRVVVSAISPWRTVLELVDGDPAPGFDRLRSMLAADRPRDGYEAKVDGVMTRLPRLPSLDPGLFSSLGVDEPLMATVAITPSLDGMEEIARLRDRGRIADRPMMLLNVPSVLDPSMKAPDGHVLSLEVLFTPYALEGGWDDSVSERWLDAFASIAGGGWRESLLRYRTMTPLDYERDLGLARGNPPAYPGDPVDVLLGRRGALTTYATPWSGLYLSGAGTYPGGGVWGAAGRNTALRVLRDLA